MRPVRWWQNAKCYYCERAVQEPTSRSRTAATRDHRVPSSRGGTHKVVCCRQCNTLKANLLPVEWAAFMRTYPRWWELPQFRDNGLSIQVRLDLARQVIELGIPREVNDPLRQAALIETYEKRIRKREDDANARAEKHEGGGATDEP